MGNSVFDKPTGATDVERHRVVEVTPSAAETIRQLLPVRRSAIGSVDGRLEAISIHRSPRVIVYHGLTNKAVTCRFQSSDVMLETVKPFLGKRVVVSGMVNWNIKSEPVSVDVEDIITVGSGERLTTQQLTGKYPDITDGMSTEEYIRSIRGD